MNLFYKEFKSKKKKYNFSFFFSGGGWGVGRGWELSEFFFWEGGGGELRVSEFFDKESTITDLDRFC